MKWMKVFLHRFPLMMCCVCLLSGCWDRIEINDVALIVGTAVDKEEDGYRVTVQIPLVGMAGGNGQGSGQGDEKIWYNESVSGKTLQDAIAGLQGRSSRRLFFGHRRVILVGEEMAKSGLSEFIDVFTHNSENRLNSFMLISRGSAAETISTSVNLEQTPAEKMRELAVQSMIKPQTVLSINEMMLTPGIDLSLPIVISHKVPFEQKEGLGLGGIALFRGDKLVGMLKTSEAIGVLWLMGEVENNHQSVPAPDGSGHIMISFHLSKVSYRPKKIGERIVMEVGVRTKGQVINNNSTYDIRLPGNLDRLEEATRNVLIKKMEDAFYQLQTVYKSDPMGFGRQVYMSMPDVWKEIGSDWNEVYLPQVELEMKMAVRIINTGTLNRSIKTTDLKGPQEGG